MRRNRMSGCRQEADVASVTGAHAEASGEDAGLWLTPLRQLDEARVRQSRKIGEYTARRPAK